MIASSLLRSLAAAGTVLCLAAPAQSAPVYSVTPTTGLFGLAPSGSVTITGTAGTATDFVSGLHAVPVGMPSGDSYYYVASNPNSSIGITVEASSFSFLWGSPDSLNRLLIDTTEGFFNFDGAMLASQFGISNNGNQSVSTIFNLSLAGGLIHNVMFTSGTNSFEFAVPIGGQVPEPASIALVLAAIGGLALTTRRR